MATLEHRPGPVAILVVHGIGDQQRGETAHKLISGLTCTSSRGAPWQPGATITVGDRDVRVYEVYWADILSGAMTRGAFQMNELQSLSWFPWFNFRGRLYEGENYPPWKLAWWCVSLPIFNFFALFAYYGCGLILQVIQNGGELPPRDGATLWQRVQAAADAGKPTAIDMMLDEYLGDVFSYVNSAADAFHREPDEPPLSDSVRSSYAAVVERFYEQMLAAQSDGCSEIQVVAHSLGTVVAYHAISGLRFDAAGRTDAAAIREATARIRRLYTIGSPLEKIRFFWPALTPPLTAAAGVQPQWENFVSWFDPVAGALTRFGGWGTVVNHRLLGGGFLRGHVVYERSQVFLRALTRGLCGRELACERRLGDRCRDWLLLAGETLLTPVAAAIVLASGLALMLVTALLLPFLVSLVLRHFLPEPTWVRIENASAVVSVISMVFVFALVPYRRAREVHRRFWVGAASRDPHQAGV
jgi:hypothetical protein